MTALLCIASFAAGYLVQWARARHQVAEAERDALALIYARHSIEADAIRCTEGA